jgi:endonuclease/exonuclease/phosphatase (EEP) superfamily protein YafD
MRTAALKLTELVDWPSADTALTGWFGWGVRRLRELFLLGVLLFWLLTLLARYGWLFDTMASLQTPLTLVLAAATCVAWLSGYRKLGLLTGAVFLLNLWSFAPFWLQQQPVAPSPDTVRVYSANLFLYNEQYEAVASQLAENGADIVLLVETDPDFFAGLSPYVDYPYSYHEINFADEGLILLSRWPLTIRQDPQLTEILRSYVLAEVATPAGSLQFLGAHTLSPSGPRSWSYRNIELAALADFAAAQPGPLVIAGDLNVTVWSPAFADLLADGHLVQARVGQGVLPTWPAFAGPLGVPIDQVLMTPDLAARSLRTLPALGSDHRPLLAELVWR